MPNVLEQSDLTQRDFDALQRRAGSIAWLRTLREEALHRFNELGFPTIRDEEWKYTSARPIATTPFELALPGSSSINDPESIKSFALRDGLIQLVFVDGHFSPMLSRVPALTGLRVSSLAEALRREPDVVHEHLARYVDERGDAFAALNTAFLEDGAYVSIDAKAKVETPIHLLFLSSNGSERPRASYPRNLVVAGRESHAAIVEHYGSLHDGVAFSNSVTEVVVGRGAKLSHYFVQDENETTYNVSLLRVHQERDSRFESHTALFGGAIVRNNVHVELQGEHCHALVNGLFVGQGTQHMDNHMRVVHAKPHGDSRQFYKGILNDRAHGVFTGRIVVQPDAQKTYANHTNRNPLLTDDPQIDARPQLEIYADDVKCTHGATTGRLNDEAIFYLESRGIDPREARAMLIQAFARESLDRMSLQAVRCLLEVELIKRLPHSASLSAIGCC